MRVSTLLLATLLGAAGAVHLAKPEVYEPTVPDWVPGTAREVVVVSGVAELAIGAALVPGRTRRLAAVGAAALFVAVFPSNVKSFLDARRPRWKWIFGLRLPLQVPLVWWAIAEARRAR